MAGFTLIDGGTSVSDENGQDIFLTVAVDPDNPVSGDIHLANGDLHLTSDDDALRQELQSRGRFVLGEWFLDTTEGVPYFEHVLVKNPNMTIVRSIFRQMIVDTPGVSVLRSLVLTLNSDRSLLVAYEVLTNRGTILSDQFESFIVKVPQA